MSLSQVPPLSDTLQSYLKAVEPLLTPKEFAETKAVVNEVGARVGMKYHNAVHAVKRFVASTHSPTVAQCAMPNYVVLSGSIVCVETRSALLDEEKSFTKLAKNWV